MSKNNTQLHKEETTSFLGVLKGIKSFINLCDSQKVYLKKALCFLMINVAAFMVYPLFMKLIFDELQLLNIQNINTEKLLTLVLVAMGLMVVNIFVLFLKRNHYMINALIKLENEWPAMAQKKLLELSMRYHEKENTGIKIAKIQKGCDKMVEMLFKLYMNIIPDAIYIVINSLIVFYLDWRLGILFTLPYLPVIIIEGRQWKKLAPKWQNYEDLKEASQGKLHQSIINITTVQNYGKEQKEIADFVSLRQKMSRIDSKNHITINRNNFITNALFEIFFYLGIGLGVYLLLHGDIKQGTIVYVITTASFTFRLIRESLDSLHYIMRNFYAVDRMKELIEEPLDIVNSAQGVYIPSPKGNILLNNIRFSYEASREGVLNGIVLSMRSGEMIALVGPSGCGKSTLIKLMTRMYDVKDGSISIDGIDIKNLDLYWYRNLFAVVQQRVDIFESSLRYNIAYSNPTACEDLVIEALYAAHLNDFLEDPKRFPDGLETAVGERGVRLSGGEQQRVGIARAYLALKKGARILVLDEATSSLDSETEKTVQEMIERLRKQQEFTIIAIAHRLSTINKADKIVVMENGEIIDVGNHERLMQRNGLYSKLVNLQNKGMIRV